MKWLAIVALAGCDWVLGVRGFESNKHDAAYIVDADHFFDAPPFGTVCVGKHLGVHVCFQQADLAPLTIAQPQTIVTDDAGCPHVVKLLDQVTVCVVAGSVLTIASDVRAVGPYPLVLVGTDEVTITGSIDVSSTQAQAGAGANDASCAPPANGSDEMEKPSGGGAGGSFAGHGGAGGSTVGQPAPFAPAIGMVTTLRGGCPAGDGGGTGRGIGGASGGAVYVTSNGPISLTGQILATGAPSSATGTTSGGAPGGGGGGSGGLIAVDGSKISLDAASLLLAAGASGGGGGSMFPGDGGMVPTGPQRAGGGVSTGTGAGGDSSGNGSLDGADGTGIGIYGTAEGGAGGGGGAAGFIYVYPTDTVSQATVVPPPS